MSKFEITATLLTIVYGLMLSDLFKSLHKLIKARKIVKWNWLPLLTSWYLFLIIIKNWWSMAIPKDNPEGYNILSFLAYGHLMILLYFLISVVLPDKIQKTGINLKAYYFKNHRYLWGLMAAVSLISLLISVVPKLFNSLPLNVSNIIGFIIFFLLTITLIISKKYWVHSVLLIFFTVMTLLEIIHKI